MQHHYFYVSVLSVMLTILGSCAPSPSANNAPTSAPGTRMFSSPAVSKQVFSPLQNDQAPHTSTININPDFNQKSNF